MNEDRTEVEQALVDAAESAMANAYCPYSHYPVGAAVRDESGVIYLGCNIENAALGSTMCAEAGALAAATVNGGRGFTHVAVVTGNGGMPCGNCRQLLLELAPDAILIVAAKDDPERIMTQPVRQLLPDPFTTFK
ncbi:MAG TPA: cytidine deaminase [Pseudomonadales bacterium]|nr:cytidine deaminase [Pseudomonadales bacterium]